MPARRPKSSRRRRTRRGGRRWPVLQLLIPISLLIVVALVAVVLLRPTPAPHVHKPAPIFAACPDVPGVIVGRILVPAGPVAGYCQPQLVNAAQIMRAAISLGIDQHGQEVGVMTAIGESGLQDLNYGDKAGPDSRGLFQQRSNWGSLVDRMDPYESSLHFYFHLLGTPGWESLPPTTAAHIVQGNANPTYYTAFWSRAQDLVEALTLDEVVVHTPIAK